ncbi:MAG: class I SAM-dependent methyltransferase [Acidobacteria bacterium]|nr:class I SAM-dependent methyltransferase [Acidobacteriota bacterium]
MDQAARQHEFFTRKAPEYDSNHASDEHEFALSWLEACIEYFRFESLLEVGAGTGRALIHIWRRFPNLRCQGIEPVKAMREEAYAKGLPPHLLTHGDAYQLDYEAGAFDVVAEFGVLHHVARPDQVVAEMLRVARKAVFLSDCNNFGHGSSVARLIKLAMNRFHIWGLYNQIRTFGKGYYVSEGDGIAYSYSLFNNLPQIQKACPHVYMLSTTGSQVTYGALLSASHFALLALKKGIS